MNITVPIQEVHCNEIHFQTTRKNNIIQGGLFTKLMYSNDVISIQGIHVSFPIIPDARTFFTAAVYAMIQHICQLEMAILYKYASTKGCGHKKKQLNLTLTQLQNIILVKCLGRAVDEKLSTNAYIMLKISGVWETNDEVGITYTMKPVSMLEPNNI
jgi:hypothetical protein